IPRGDYVIKVNNRKILDGVMEAIGLGGEENAGRRLTVLRAIDKFDRLGKEGVSALLGEGRRDESGAFTPGAMLDADQASVVIAYVATDSLSTKLNSASSVSATSQEATVSFQVPTLGFSGALELMDSPVFLQGMRELA